MWSIHSFNEMRPIHNELLGIPPRLLLSLVFLFLSTFLQQCSPFSHYSPTPPCVSPNPIRHDNKCPSSIKLYINGNLNSILATGASTTKTLGGADANGGSQNGVGSTRAEFYGDVRSLTMRDFVLQLAITDAICFIAILLLHRQRPKPL